MHFLLWGSCSYSSSQSLFHEIIDSTFPFFPQSFPTKNKITKCH
eukprot:UN17451